MTATIRRVAWCWVPPLSGDPWLNLATDDALLRSCSDFVSLRVYTWDRPCVSLGYFQSFSVCREHFPRTLPLIRRPTGGGAIEHGLDITYSVVAPLDIFGGRTKSAYRMIHGAVRRALARLGVPVEERGQGRDEGPAGPVRCFARRGCFDLVFQGNKIVGSAQRRSGRCFLQHGSISWRASSEGQVSLEAIADRRIEAGDFAEALCEAFGGVLGPASRVGLPRDVEEAAAALRSRRYLCDAWNQKR